MQESQRAIQASHGRFKMFQVQKILSFSNNIRSCSCQCLYIERESARETFKSTQCTIKPKEQRQQLVRDATPNFQLTKNSEYIYPKEAHTKLFISYGGVSREAI